MALTGPEDRSFITYEEHLDALTVPEDLGPVAATHVGIAKPLPDWVARLRAGGHHGRRRGRVGPHRRVVGRRARPARRGRRLRAERRRGDAVHAHRHGARRREGPRRAGARSPSSPAAARRRRRGRLGERRRRHGGRPSRVDVVDPTGAGDVFVATFMAGAHHGWDLSTRLRFAAASAAYAVTGLGGAASAPRPRAAPCLPAPDGRPRRLVVPRRARPQPLTPRPHSPNPKPTRRTGPP